MFYSHVYIGTLIAYVTAVVLVFVYTSLRFSKEAHLFSFYNMYLYMEWMTLLIISPFLFYPKGLGHILTWTKSFSVSCRYLEKAIFLNCIGEIFFLIVLIYEEFYKKEKLLVKKKSSSFMEGKSNVRVWFLPDWLVYIEFIFFLIVAIVIDVFCLGGLPIYSDTSTVLLSAWRVPYLICLNVIPIYTLYFGIYFVSEKKRLFLFFLGIFMTYSYGKRSTLIFWILIPLAVYIIYGKGKTKKFRSNNFKLAILAFILAVIGLSMIFTRSGRDFDFFKLVGESVTGDTFADIRDGGWILCAYESLKESWLMGKTYLASLLTFIPSSIFQYKKVYGWGAYTSYTLLNMSNHPGLRGGAFMEAYMNFSWIGVATIGIIRGICVGKFEKISHKILIEHQKIHSSNFLYIVLCFSLLNCFSCSGGMQSVYVILLLLCINYCICRVMKGRCGK